MYLNLKLKLKEQTMPYINPMNYIFFILAGLDTGKWTRAWCVIFHKNVTLRRVYSVEPDPDFPDVTWQIKYHDYCSKCDTSSIITDDYPLMRKTHLDERCGLEPPLCYDYQQAVSFAIKRAVELKER